jgi:hypothetical protein
MSRALAELTVYFLLVYVTLILGPRVAAALLEGGAR